MLIGRYLLGICLTLLLAACEETGPQDDRIEGSDPNPKPLGMAERTHAYPDELPLFTSADIPQSLPRRDDPFASSGIGLVVKQSQGYSSVQPMYNLGVSEQYARNGSGHAVPISVRVDPATFAYARYPLDTNRRVILSREYEFSGSFNSEKNRNSAIRLTKEVLEKTYCAGGTVTENYENGNFATAYGRGARSADGLSIYPGWVVNYRCSKWRAK